ncbi:hypothetical protein C5167_029078 [Papaver somniferum]|nr:uncharacterized protein LOC113337127 isoform X2 [Papaver somniferum]XP_026438593.1 uncharacterized protein LOC113337127 isoform X2 [Papaver somniferum]RZC90015.1 hypothetical protein C5167_029078 [Papaver somniferum]
MEQSASIIGDIKLLKNEVVRGSLSKEQIAERLHLMELSLAYLKEKENEKEAKEEVEKGLRQRIKNVNEDLEKIDKSEIESRKDTNTSLDDIRLRNMMFQSFVFGAYQEEAEV